MMHEAPESRSPAGRPAPHRLFPIAGVSVAVLVVLAHLAGGAALLHLSREGIPANFGGDAPLMALAAVVGVKLLLVVVARHWWRHR